ncbi:MAG: hypothetical protein RL745_996 [Actinomycetota bacterium]|jgi:dTMP kinase
MAVPGIGDGVGGDARSTASARVNGAFIVFEGGEGVGKSTQVARLAEFLQEQFAGLEVITTREPGGTVAAEALRAVVLSSGYEGLDLRAEALVFAAARADHVAQVIKPALERGAVVLCDRFIDSSVVYQGIARGLGTEEIERLSVWATAGLLPDTVIVLDLPAEVGMSRIGDPDRLEAAGSDFHDAVRHGFLARAASGGSRYVVIDASVDIAQVQSQIREVVLARHFGGTH